MAQIHPYFLHLLVETFTRQADEDDAVARYWGWDLDDPEYARCQIREEILPAVRFYVAEGRVTYADLIATLEHYTADPGYDDFGRIIDAVLPPFKVPDDPRQFFIRCLEEIRGGDSA